MDNQTPQVPEDQIIAEMQCAYLDGIAKSDHTLCATGKACCEGMKAVLAVVRKHAAPAAATESKDEWQARALKAEREVERLKLQSEHANAYWDDDGDFQSPEEYADEMDLKVGEHLMLKFGISTPQASKDLNLFKRLHPGLIAYDLTAKQYRSARKESND